MNRFDRARLVVLTAAALALLAIAVASASADPAAPLPSYDGAMDYRAITEPASPEEYSWRVALNPGQSLKLDDPQHAEIDYESGHLAFGIDPEPAHDADGATVPTSLAVSEGDVITLIVHHREGNPAAAGAPFVYPVSGGQGWESGYSTVIVTGPPDETELREARERITREKRDTEQGTAKTPERCIVPRLRAGSLKASKRWLRESDCKIGTVRKRRNATAATGKVVKQSPRPGTELAPGTSIDVTLGE